MNEYTMGTKCVQAGYTRVMANRVRSRSCSLLHLSMTPVRIWENYLIWKQADILHTLAESNQRSRSS